MFHVVYEKATGKNISETSIEPDTAELSAKGMAYKSFDVKPENWTWDAVKKDVVSFQLERFLPVSLFLDRLTDTELESIVSAKKANVKIQAIFVRLDNSRTINRKKLSRFLDYFIEQGHINPPRKPEILS